MKSAIVFRYMILDFSIFSLTIVGHIVEFSYGFLQLVPICILLCLILRSPIRSLNTEDK